MIPHFDRDRINFVKFIQENKDIFYELLESGTYNLTRNFNEKYIYEGYYFFKNFNLGDDADTYNLIEDLNTFNITGKTKIQAIINEFEKWLHRDIVWKKYLKKNTTKKYNLKKKKIKKLNREPLNQVEEIGVRRTMKRTSISNKKWIVRYRLCTRRQKKFSKW